MNQAFINDGITKSKHMKYFDKNSYLSLRDLFWFVVRSEYMSKGKHSGL